MGAMNGATLQLAEQFAPALAARPGLSGFAVLQDGAQALLSRTALASQAAERIDLQTDSDSVAGHFLELLHGKPAPADWVRAMQTSLNLYAEHEFNASTFTARVIIATRSDIASAILRPRLARRQR